jgi:hypothetical protein
MKSLFQLLKLRFRGHWATIFHIRFPLGSSSVHSGTGLICEMVLVKKLKDIVQPKKMGV